jgi:hypothetical protein
MAPSAGQSATAGAAAAAPAAGRSSGRRLGAHPACEFVIARVFQLARSPGRVTVPDSVREAACWSIGS